MTYREILVAAGLPETFENFVRLADVLGEPDAVGFPDALFSESVDIPALLEAFFDPDFSNLFD